MNRILIWLAGISGLLAAFFKLRGDALKEKAKSAEKRADDYQEVIEDVEIANRVRNDDDARVRAEKKYSRD